MSTQEFRVGDIVDITREIIGARVIRLLTTGITVEADDQNYRIYFDDPTYTVTQRTPAAPTLQAGEVWRLTDGSQVSVIRLQGVVMTVDMATGLYRLPSKVDFADAERLFPRQVYMTSGPATPEGSSTGMLRKFKDCDGDTWTETKPESGRFHLGNNDCLSSECHNSDYCGNPLRYVSENYGPIKDLDSIPVGGASC